LRKITIPAIGKSTSALGFGTGGLLRIGSRRQRLRTLEAAFESGITHFDTAPIYGFGESERTLGRFLRGRRANVTLVTKFGLKPSAVARRLAGLQGIGRRVFALLPAVRRVAARSTTPLYAKPDFSPPEVQAALERSLRALRTDYVDCYLAHQICARSLPGDELVELLDRLRRAGKIRSFGIATDFVNIEPVLGSRPELSRVVQFDSDVTRGDVAKVVPTSDRLLITFGSLHRSIVVCRERLQAFTRSAPIDPSLRHVDFDELRSLDDDAMGEILIRAAVLANPNGIVLMQSRHIERIRRNARAAGDDSANERAQMLARIAGGPLC
jgi:D-threo-aldose 1-dehydrogenase